MTLGFSVWEFGSLGFRIFGIRGLALYEGLAVWGFGVLGSVFSKRRS